MSLAYGSAAPQPLLPAQRLAQLEAVYASVSIGLCLIDRDRHVVSMNPHFASIFASAERPRGVDQSHQTISLPEKLEAAIARAVDGAAEPDLEFSRAFADENTRTFACTFELARDHSGESLGVSIAVIEITQYKRAEAALTEASRLLDVSAREDYLTGLPNRRALDEALAREAGRAARTRTPLAVVMLDVDRFKNFNDSYGHIEGDRCLTAIARALKSAITRPDDLVARYGGEEFAIVLPDTNVEGAMHVAERAASAVRALRLAHADVPLGIVTVSAGVAVVEPNPVSDNAPDDSAARVLHDADRALYVAKYAGRNLVVLSPHSSGH